MLLRLPGKCGYALLCYPSLHCLHVESPVVSLRLIMGLCSCAAELPQIDLCSISLTSKWELSTTAGLMKEMICYWVNWIYWTGANCKVLFYTHTHIANIYVYIYIENMYSSKTENSNVNTWNWVIHLHIHRLNIQQIRFNKTRTTWGKEKGFP